MTTPSIFWRLFWKEYRLQRALWFAVTLLTVLLIGFEFLVIDGPDRRFWTFWIAMTIPAIFPLGCGAVLFAGEHDSGTFEFQKSLPVEAETVFFAKIFFALVNTVLMFCLMWIFAAFVCGWDIPERAKWLLPATMGAAAMLALLWASFFSMLLKNVLSAAVVGGIVTFVTILMVSSPLATEEPTILSMSVRLGALIAVVAMLNLWLGVDWFRDRRWNRTRRLLPAVISEPQTDSTACDKIYSAPKARTVVARLVWQHWRQLWLYAKYVFLALAVLAVVLYSSSNTILVWTNKFTGMFDRSSLGLFFMGFFGLITSVFGVYTFHGDQVGGGFRFLSDRGVSPKLIWLSRQLLILFPILLILPIPVGIFSLRCSSCDARQFFFILWYVVLLFANTTIIGIYAGQLFSMFFRSAILAVLFSTLLTFALMAWNWLIMIWHVNFLWAVAPIPLAMLLATWLRTPYWLVDRKDWRSWLPSGLAIAVPCVAIVVGTLCYRAFEFPLVDPGFSVAELNRTLTPDENKTVDLYRQAIQNLKPEKIEKKTNGDENPEIKKSLDDNAVAWVNANQKPIALAVEASRGKLLPVLGSPLDASAMFKLATLLVYRAEMLEKQTGPNNLDESFDYYLAALRISLHLGNLRSFGFVYDLERCVYNRLTKWAMHENQTTERIANAIRELQKLPSNMSPSTAIKYAYLDLKRAILNDPGAIDPKYANSTLAAVWQKLPWERERAVRLLNQETLSQLTMASCIEKAVARGEPFAAVQKQHRVLQAATALTPCPSPKGRGELLLDGHFAWSFYQEGAQVPWETRPGRYTYNIAHGILNREILVARQRDIELNYAAQQTHRRAVQLIMALEDWKRQHGSLPKKLDDLIGVYFDRLPVDPFSGRPFRYFPKGVKGSFSRLGNWSHLEIDIGEVKPNKPFIWATGPRVRHVSHTEDPLAQYEINSGTVNYERGHSSTWQRPDSPYHVWCNGWPVPIP